jgi:hypothetical protein
MTQWGLDTLFNPAKRHMDEEKRRLQTTREQLGDSSGGRRVDLESGKVTIQRHESDADDGEKTTEAESATNAEATTDEKSATNAKSTRSAKAKSDAGAPTRPELDPNTPAGRARLRRQAAKR